MAARTKKRGASPEGKMSLGQHLVELRKRFTRAGLAILLGAVAGWFIADPVWTLLKEPITRVAEAYGREAQLVFPTITSSFDLKMQIAIYVGIFVSSPVWLYQIFAFIVPGLTRREKGYIFGFFFTAVPLFIAGCAAGWYVLPNIVTLLAGFAPEGTASLFAAKEYLHFVVKLMLAIGVGFVLPVFLVILNFMGVVSGRGLLAGWRWAILLITLFTAIATPAADVFSMFLLAVPMVVLYFLAVGVAFWHDRIAARKLKTLEAELGEPSTA